MAISALTIDKAQALAFELTDTAELARAAAMGAPIIREAIKEAVRLSSDLTKPGSERRTELSAIQSDSSEAIRVFGDMSRKALNFPTRAVGFIERDDEQGLLDLIDEARIDIDEVLKVIK